MNLNNQQIQALYQLYPSVATVQGDIAYDSYGNEVSYNIMSVDNQAAINSCKSQATALLQATDWTTIPDVANPVISNPYLMNQSEFAAYRSTVRNLAVNPVADPVFPVQPTEQWSS